MKLDINKIFKTPPKESFFDFLATKQKEDAAEARFKQALDIVNSEGYEVLTKDEYQKRIKK